MMVPLGNVTRMLDVAGLMLTRFVSSEEKKWPLLPVSAMLRLLSGGPSKTVELHKKVLSMLLCSRLLCVLGFPPSQAETGFR
jgi:hypothetical protein